MIPVMILFHVLGFISSIHAVMGTRTAQGAVAWTHKGNFSIVLPIKSKVLSNYWQLDYFFLALSFFVIVFQILYGYLWLGWVL